MSRPDSSQTEALIAVARHLERAAAEQSLRAFRPAGGIGAENKLASGFDPVTEADRAAEAAMRAVLADLRPEDGIHGEEHGVARGTSGLTWVLDPIDGTRGYLSGTPTWGTLIALCDEDDDGPGQPHLGLIAQPYIGESFLGGFGMAELAGPRGTMPLAVRKGVGLAEAVLFTTFPEVGSPEEGAAFARLSRQVRLTRYGMDCYAYALLAAGQIDLVVEAGLQPYDVAAPIAVIEAAGGIVTDWQGNPCWRGGRVLAAASPEIHAAALEILAG